MKQEKAYFISQGKISLTLFWKGDEDFASLDATHVGVSPLHTHVEITC